MCTFRETVSDRIGNERYIICKYIRNRDSSNHNIPHSIRLLWCDPKFGAQQEQQQTHCGSELIVQKLGLFLSSAVRRDEVEEGQISDEDDDDGGWIWSLGNGCCIKYIEKVFCRGAKSRQESWQIVRHLINHHHRCCWDYIEPSLMGISVAIGVSPGGHLCTYLSLCSHHYIIQITLNERPSSNLWPIFITPSSPSFALAKW